MYQSFYWYLLSCAVSIFREAVQEPSFDLWIVHAEHPQGSEFFHQFIVIILHLDIAFHKRIAQTSVGIRCGLGNCFDFNGIIREGSSQLHNHSAFIGVESTSGFHELLTYENGASAMINKHFRFLHFGSVLFCSLWSYYT